MHSRVFELQLLKLLPQSTFTQLKQIHALLITTSLNQNLQIFSKFFRRSTEFGTMEYSGLIFSQLGHSFNREVILWNIMLRGYSFNGLSHKCISLYDEMPLRGLKPCNYSYPYVLNSCSNMGWYRKGKIVHCQIVKSGFEFAYAVAISLFNMYMRTLDSDNVGGVNEGSLGDARKVFDDMSMRPVELWNKMISGYISIGHVESSRCLFDTMLERDVVSWNCMLSGYAKIGDAEKARDLFQQMPDKNVISWTSMISTYANAGDLITARKFFDNMPSRNVVSWNTMLSSYSQHGEYGTALDIFVQMQSQGVISDGYTFVSVLSACSHLCALEFGKLVHYLIKDWSQLGVIVRTALIDMYAKCGEINMAFTLFFKIGKKDVFCWNVMINSLAIHGRAEDAMKIFYMMQKSGLIPNDFTFSGALFACSHGGLVREGQKIFNGMEKYFGVSPKIEHYGCLVDLLSRNGKLEEAMYLIKDMPFKPDIAIWGALLGGCKIKSDFKLAVEVMDRVTDLKADEPGVYALLSNMYASVGQWPDALTIRETMEDKKIEKNTGISSVICNVSNERPDLRKKKESKC
ncbi:Pentatricopeptide repeat [Quillaja saponaria]|uniref:Pentatricopeptide repeat n=1 Tax=Quillaja saponaria TaxID=32244 RepID=A0AAD7PWI9_QUISA|nr:Pentatricopeptide repeat [Quillaja saponaria]